MSSHLSLLPYKNPFDLYFSFHITLPVSETPFSSQIFSPLSSTMTKTRGSHSYRPRVRRSSTPLVDTSTPAAAAAAAPSAPSRAPQQSPPPAALRLPRAPHLPPLPQLLMLRAPPLRPLPKGDIIPGWAPLRLLYRIPGQPRGPHRPRGLRPRV